MEQLDFGSSDIGTLIPPTPKTDEILIDENKSDLQQMNMTEFSSSVDDLLPLPPAGMADAGIYVNPTSGRTTGISLPEKQEEKKKKSTNPFNLTNDQYQAIIAGVSGIIVYSTSVQTKLSSIVPNFNGINGSIASAILIAILFFFARNYLMK
jgi:hypothetical protein